MILPSKLQQKDHRYIWHPCSQMKDYEQVPPLPIRSASGSELTLENGKKIIDAISSWWCKSLGHGHPQLKKAIAMQIDRFEHVIFAHTTNETIVSLSAQLCHLMPGLDKVFYAGDGSCAVEIAMKMSMHARQIQGARQKTQFIALENAYHGETMGALSLSDLGLYRQAYEPLLFQPVFLAGVPYVNSISDPLWQDASEAFAAIEPILVQQAKKTTAIIVEPIVQGAAGMRIYSQDFLKRLAAFAKAHDIHLIADEIMTGIARTGTMLACEHAGIQPDFVCLSKGLTSGWLPFSAVLTQNPIYNLFYDDYQSGKSFLHSHTFSGNVLGAALALETLAIIESERLCDRAVQLGKLMRQQMQEIADETGKLKNVRQLGAIVAADLIDHTPNNRLSFRLYREAISRGVLLRPIAETIYWLPPLNIEFELLKQLQLNTLEAIQALDKVTPS